MEKVMYLFGEHFDEFVEKTELAQLLMEPLATVLDTSLQQLTGQGGRERVS